MKAPKFITTAVIAGMMVTGAGYAYWTDALTVDNTVSTGEFDVEFVDEGFLPLQLAVDTTGETKYMMDSTISQDADQLTVNFENMYPGAMGLYAAKVENTGSIPAKLKNVEVDFSEAAGVLANDMKAAGGYVHFDENNNYKGGKFFIGNLNNLETKLDTMLQNLQMEPGDYILFDIPDEYKDEVAAEIPAYNPDEQNCIIFYLDHNSNNDSENLTTQFDIKFNWEQHNAQ